MMGLALLLAACGGDSGGGGAAPAAGNTPPPDPDPPPELLTVTSGSVDAGGDLPLVHACIAQGGSERSPHFAWSGAPAGTAGYALIMDDEDPPCGEGIQACRHWAVLNIPASVTELPEADPPRDLDPAIREGLNYAGTSDYAGPCPPQRHSYRTTVYALADSMPVLSQDAALTRAGFLAAHGDHVLATGTLEAGYDPSGQ